MRIGVGSPWESCGMRIASGLLMGKGIVAWECEWHIVCFETSLLRIHIKCDTNMFFS